RRRPAARRCRSGAAADLRGAELVGAVVRPAKTRVARPDHRRGDRPLHLRRTTRMSYRSVFAPGLFAGRIVIVTGGGSGIGRCTAHELAALGATPVLAGRDAAKLQAAADEIRADGGQVDTAV